MPETPKGLATVAFLKTRLDEGHDHIGMFEPLVYDALHGLTDQDFLARDVKKQILNRSNIQLPRATVSTLLRRLTRRGFLVRKGGRFFRTTNPIPRSDFDQAVERISAEQRALGAALVHYAADNGRGFGSEESALEALATFVSDNKVDLVLDEAFRDSPLDRSSESRKIVRLIARFVTEQCLDPLQHHHPAFKALVEGIILSDTALLTDLDKAAERFHALTVVLDTPVVFSALGFQGTANSLAAKEGIALLSKAGARTIVFMATVHEMRGILAIYEERVATTKGRLSLRSTPLSHHVLSSRLSSADLRIISATLEERVQGAGVKIRDLPPRQSRYTLGERELAKKLLDQDEEDTNRPRIRHDVDCIAGVLTLRAGRTSTSIERAGAIFCTSSGRVVKNVQNWFADETRGQGGIPPIIHQEALTSIAWFKTPGTSSLKIHELAAVCAAAMRPTSQTWTKFVDSLRRLRSDGSITDDEIAAIVVSELTEPLLARLDDDGDADADSITEAIERIRETYRNEATRAADGVRQQAKGEVAMAEQVANEARARTAQLQDVIDTNVRRNSRAFANFGLVLTVALAMASVALAFGIVDYASATWGARIVLLLAAGVGLYSTIIGHSLMDMRNSCEDWIAGKLRRRWRPRTPISGKDYVLLESTRYGRSTGDSSSGVKNPRHPDA